MEGLKMKNIISLSKGAGILLILTTLFLAACSSGEESSTATADQPYHGEEVNLIMDRDDGTADLRDNWISEFEDETGITVNVEILPESGYDTKLNLAISSGQEDYDVVRTGVKNWNQLVSSGWRSEEHTSELQS